MLDFLFITMVISISRKRIEKRKEKKRREKQ